MNWFEFQIQSEDEIDLVARLKALLDIATRLTAGGWPTRWTLTGLGFAAPHADSVADQLAALGVEEPFTDVPSRTLGEVCDAVGRLHDRLRERGLDEEARATLSALRWALGDPTTHTCLLI
jgi:hypothetical protein